MRIAVAGTGSIGQRHLQHLSGLLPLAHWVLLRSGCREDSLSAALCAEVVASLEASMTDPLDALVIATPSAFHAELVQQGLSLGLPMYIEKPVVTTSAQLQAVQVAFNSCVNPPFTQVGCNLRFLPSLQRLRNLLLEGAIGCVVRASLEAGQWLPDWRPQQDHRLSYSADPQQGGGVLMDLIHEVDAARWLLGQLTPVACSTAQVPSLHIASEGAATALLRSADGALVQIGLDYVARRPLRRYQLVGDRGTLIWDLASQTLVLQTPQGQLTVDCGASGFDVAATYRTAMQAFLAGLRGEASPVQPLQDGLASAALAIALKEMACQNP